MYERDRCCETTSEITKAIASSAYHTYEKRLLREVLSGPIPRHVAVVMDGNRRFARELGLFPEQGHARGQHKLEEMLTWCMELGIRILTVFAFSTENLKRKPEEVEYLMRMFAENFRKLAEEPRVHENRIRVRVIGQKDLLPEYVQETIRDAEERTKGYDQYQFNLAVAYGGREEILQAIRRIAEDVRSGMMSPEEIDEESFSRRLYTADLPDPDLILRTSGEERISNFLLWQLAYSELYFSDVYWPGLRKIDFLRAVRSYQNRVRRFGT